MSDNAFPHRDTVAGGSTTVNQAFGSDVTRLVALAALAPSSHNTQPWHFRASDTAIDVFADRTRALPAKLFGHSARATTSASCAISSARSTFRTTRARPAMSLARSMRKVASIARCVSAWWVSPAATPHCRRRPQGRQACRAEARS